MLREPIVVIIAAGTPLVQAIILLLIAFNVPITASQQAAITTVAGLLLAAIARTQVVPVAQLPAGVAAQIADAKAAQSANTSGGQP